MHKCYLFNPDHDLALANGSQNYEAPLSARVFAADLACLPLWYAEAGSEVLVPQVDEAWWKGCCTLFPQLSTVRPTTVMHSSRLSPWGWNAALVRRLHLTAAEDVSAIRTLSHRRWSIAAMEYVRQRVSFALPVAAVELRSMAEVLAFVAQHERCILKAPLSGSGRGVWRCFGALSQSADGWVRRTLSQQGSVMGEVLHSKVLDFAMEFAIEQGQVRFAGYSLFRTEAMGVYVGNVLGDDDALECAIARYVPKEQLHEVREALCEFLQAHYSGYTGYVGVDMLIYEVRGEFRINPMVEINVRMTMGMVARRFYDVFVSCGGGGKFSVERFESNAALRESDAYMRARYPLEVCDGRIVRGYWSLCPISDTATYRLSVIVE